MTNTSESSGASPPAPAAAPGQRQFPCKSCGASLHFAPGTTSLTCEHCGTLNQIEASVDRVEEIDFRQTLATLSRETPTEEVLVVQCNVCGAESSLGANVTADACPCCGSAIVATARSRKQLRPGSLLPFHITHDQAQASFRAWLAGLWFAPSALTRQADADGIKGLYLPAWTYDSDTTTQYTGQRGDDYWDTETYTEMENGRPVTKTRQVLRTRWTSVSGTVANSFDDVLVQAATNLPRKHLDALEPWDLSHLIPYKDDYLSGFVSQSYQVSLSDGFNAAREIMDVTIRQTIASDIGGDHQRIGSANTSYFDITFKHILLPVWLSAYRFNGATYHFLVNARTGEVRGDRPYSFWKILFVILAAIAVALVIVAVAQAR